VRQRALVMTVVACVALPALARATGSPIYTELPPSGAYKFHGVGPPGEGSLTVHARQVSKISFTLPTGPAYHQPGCIAPEGASEKSTLLITVKGRFTLVRQNASVAGGYRYWVVGGVKQPHPANSVGVAPIPATFKFEGHAPVTGKLGIFFANNGDGLEMGQLYAHFTKCVEESGSFEHR
jgi:hypothetical protein